MDPVEIPTEIDAPQQFLLWSVDEFLPFMFLLVIGNLAGHVVLGAVLRL